MKIAVVYESSTGNTKQIAEAVCDEIKALGKGELVYFGTPQNEVEADVYFVGSWVDKGNCTEGIAGFLRTLQGKKIAYFCTAGFGGSGEYYDALFKRVKAVVSDSNEMAAPFFCQGKMPMAIRSRYEKLLTQHPEDRQMQVNIENFDKALTHPDDTDLAAAKAWVGNLQYLFE